VSRGGHEHLVNVGLTHNMSYGREHDMTDTDVTTRSNSTGDQPPPVPGVDASAALVPATAVGMPPTAQAFFAVVNADGTLARGFQASSASKLSTGTYQVIFAHDITGSAYIGTLGLSGSIGGSPSGQIAVVGRFGTPNGVFVQTFDAAGNAADRGFHLAILS
jgi:hypothetical protein